MHKKRFFPLTVMLLLALSGCASLPESGPVVAGQPGLAASDTIVARASGPVRGSTPEQLMRDFKQACNAGPFEDFATAKLYLTRSEANRWNPRERQTILAQKDGYVISAEQSSDNQSKNLQPMFTATGKSILVIDRFGRKLANSGDYRGVFKLAKEKGEWRISELPQGVALSASSFQYSYARRDVYFPSVTGKMLISDPRWLPRESVPKRIVEAVLGGPSLALMPALNHSAPYKNMKIASIDIKNSEAQISFTEDSVIPSNQVLSFLRWQLINSLSSVSGINDVSIYYRDKILDVPVPMIENVFSENRVTGITGRGVIVQPARLIGNSDNISVLADHKSVDSYGITWPTIGKSRKSPAIALGNNKDILQLVSGGNPVVLYSDKSLYHPSIDPYNWIWAGNPDKLLDVHALQVGGIKQPIKVLGFPSHARILQLNIDSFGVRAAMVISKSGKTELWLAVIGRDGDGVPSSLTAEENLGVVTAGVASLGWYNDTGFALMQRESSGEQIVEYPINSFSASHDAPDQATFIVQNPPERKLQVVDSSLTRKELRRDSWFSLDSGINYLSFSG